MSLAAGPGPRRLTVRDLDFAGKRALVRVDFNVPVDAGRVADATRIRASLPTIEYLVGRGAALVLMSHLGRPKGKADPRLSLAPVAAELASLLGREVLFVPQVLGEDARAATSVLEPGQVALLENVRFYPGDESNDPAMAEELARHGQIYVNDAFGAAHRAHASTSGVAAYLPAVAGLLMERELTVLGGLLVRPVKPFAVVLGGAKVRDKLGVIDSLLDCCDILALGGGMANTFLAAQGHQLGKSLVETDMADLAAALLAKAERRGVPVILPQDLAVAEALEPGAKITLVTPGGVAHDMAAFDIGPRTADAIAQAIGGAATIFWNGTMGVYEVPEFAKGTASVARAIAAATSRGAVTVAAGGDSLAAVAAAGLEASFSHLSTGGGASLELLEGKPLPGVTCLLEAEYAD